MPNGESLSVAPEIRVIPSDVPRTDPLSSQASLPAHVSESQGETVIRPHKATFNVDITNDESERPSPTDSHHDDDRASTSSAENGGRRTRFSISNLKETANGHSPGTAQETPPKKGRLSHKATNAMDKVMAHRWFSWIPPKLTWGNMKPVLRCAISAWLGLVILLIQPSENALGIAAFFVLVVAFMIPPTAPLIQSLEIFANLFFFNGIAWAWVVIGVAIAHSTRMDTDPAKVAAAEAKWAYLIDDPTTYERKIIYDATYLQAKPAVVCAVFLSVGTGALLWWKLKTAPSPATFPLVLSCVLIDISFTTAALYPTPLYTSGLLFFLPMAVQAAIAIVVSLFIFPESVGHSFQSKFVGVLDPLAKAMTSIEKLFGDASANPIIAAQGSSMLRVDQDDPEERLATKMELWAEQSKKIREQLLLSLGGLPPLRAQQRYLNVDISYSRLEGHDLRDLFDLLAAVQVRSGGLAFFFDVITANARHSHLDSSAFSVHEASHSRPNSRPPSIRGEQSLGHRSSWDATDDHNGATTPPTEDEGVDDSTHERTASYFSTKKLHFPSFLHRRSDSPHGSHGHKGSHLSLLDHLRKSQQPVGVYESQRYMDIEKAFSADTEHVLEQLDLLAVGSLPLVRACFAALSASSAWLVTVNKDRRVLPIPRFLHIGPSKQRVATEEKSAALGIENVTAELQSALDDFKVTRLEIIKPYRHLFDPAHPHPIDMARIKIHHRGLFWGFVAQYHLMEFAEALLMFLRNIEELNRNRKEPRFWYPKLSTLITHLQQSHREPHLTDGDDGHDNDVAFNDNDEDVLGAAKRRNPEYTPFENPWLNLLSRLASFPDILGSRSFMYAVKAAILGALTSLPAFIASSSSFYYYNRGIWCTIMAQMTLSVFSGDTASAWVARLIATFWGCLVGMVIWYIGSGSSQGNPYGLAAACAVAFPFASFFRTHFPGQILTSVMSTVSMGLVIGYSYLNGTVGAQTNAEWGWDVAWRRFVCVIIGITAAWIFCYVPPVSSGKRAVRTSYAVTIGAAGSILCDILSNANDHHYHIKESLEIRQSLLTWRSKLNKLGTRHANIRYEYSLKGRWPEERYKGLLDTLQDMLSLLSQLNHVLCQLDRPWRKALLDRTRLSDPVFLGDVLAVISLSSNALKAGTALPQITPSPLVARFRMGKTKGLDVSHDPADQSGELPNLLTVDVLESDNYMRYALGITTTYSLIARLDKMVVVCKTLLGENYHVSGLHLDQTQV